jgi:hypothetical protein
MEPLYQLAMSSAPPGASLGVILMAVLVGIAVLCVLAHGLMSPRETWDLEQGAGILSRLKKRRAHLLRSIKDLELARESGSISGDELRELRNDLKMRAVIVTRDLERSRKARLRSVLKGLKGLTPSQRKHVEELVRERLARISAPGAPAGSGNRAPTIEEGSPWKIEAKGDGI